MVELLTVLAIITILVALLLPALAMVRKAAKETQQKAQLTTIGLALTAFKNDYGDYLPSDWQGDPLRTDYSGAQMLAEALVGWDLMGFHPKSVWRADGGDASGASGTDAYLGATTGTAAEREQNLRERRGPYLELATANVFRLGNISATKPGLFSSTGPLAGDTFVLCDVFGVRKVTLAMGKTVKAGTPILYYRANTARKNIDASLYDERIYNVYDNYFLVDLKALTTDGQLGKAHPLGASLDVLYDYIRDPKVTAVDWPYRPDSYILISAGADGLYGPVYGTTGDPVYWTTDDITNFGN